MNRVLVTPEAMRFPDGPYCQLLRDAGFDVQFPRNPEMARGKLSEDQVIEELRGFSAAIAGGETYSPRVIESVPELRVIARAGVGYDAVHVPTATAHRVAVTITPNSNHECVAELTLTLMLTLTKRILVNDRTTRAGQWNRQPLGALRTKTHGIVGLGRIGRSLAKRSVALGLKVIAFDAMPNEEVARSLNVTMVDFDTLLAQSDYVTLHCPLNEETRGLINRETLAKMKPGSILVNMARGKLVVESDLLEALQSGPLQAAGLDVFEQEPPDANNPLFKLDNVVVCPHMGGVDELSIVGMGMEAAQSIVDLQRGHWPAEQVVNQELRNGWTW